jgi:hypothetical protein
MLMKTALRLMGKFGTVRGWETTGLFGIPVKGHEVVLSNGNKVRVCPTRDGQRVNWFAAVFVTAQGRTYCAHTLGHTLAMALQRHREVDTPWGKVLVEEMYTYFQHRFTRMVTVWVNDKHINGVGATLEALALQFAEGGAAEPVLDYIEEHKAYDEAEHMLISMGR